MTAATNGIRRVDGNVESFVGFVQLYSKESATTLKSTAMVVYPIQPILLYVSARRTQCFIEN